jgi:L-seryl-tRNA(Ser) seleniumtransferase
MTGERDQVAADLDRLARDSDRSPDTTAAGAVYRRLGVEPIINGRSTFTILGGSLMPPEVLDAMREAAACFVDLTELGAAVGRRLADLTRNEAAFVSGGAAAGLFLSAAACMARRTDDGVLRPADLDHYPRDFVIHRAHRVPYDAVVELAGGRLVEIGPAIGAATAARTGVDAVGVAGPKTEQELEDALGPGTAAILYVPKPHLESQVLPLPTLVEAARRHEVPVIVDAAAQLPPRANLWRFTREGADLVLFSGGKALCGPASSGLVLGRTDYVGRVAANAAPLHRPGRPMKVGKEDMVGLLAAVEWYLAQDEAEESRRFEAIVDHLVRWGRTRDDVTVTRAPYGEAGQPTPRAHIRLARAEPGYRDALLTSLRRSPPRIDLLADDDVGFYVAPETLQVGEEVVIAERLAAELERDRAELEQNAAAADPSAATDRTDAALASGRDPAE